MFNFFKEKCPVCKMGLEKGKEYPKGYGKKFCSENCREEFRKKIVKEQSKSFQRMLSLSMFGIWQKIKKNHFLLMVLCCVIPIVLAICFFALFRGGSSWAWLFILLCPVLHFWLMRGHKHGGNHKKDINDF